MRIRATSSLEIARSFSPAASSVVSISERAVETHAASGRPARFLKPRTAMALRGARAAAEAVRGPERAGRIRTTKNPAAAATRIPAAASARWRRRRRSRGPAAIVSPCSAATTSAVDA